LIGTFCTVGNLKKPFDRFFKIIFNSIDNLPKPILIQSGYNKIKNTNNYDFQDFFQMNEHQKYLENSKVVISHAGAGTIFQCLNLNKRPIVIPRLKKFDEHVNDHQLDLALKLKDLNLIYVVEEELISMQLIKENKLSSEDKIKSDPLIYKLHKRINTIVNK